MTNNSRRSLVHTYDSKLHPKTGTELARCEGTYQHCAGRHLHRYLAEFDFRYNNHTRFIVDDLMGCGNGLKAIGGKRFSRRRVSSTAIAQAESEAPVEERNRRLDSRK